MNEFELHRAASQFLDLALPADALHAAIDSAGKASPVIGARLKARGGKKGFPDHIIFYHGLVLTLEFKSERGRLSPEQIDIGHKLRQNGVSWTVCKSVVDVEMALIAAGILTRARLSAR